MSYWERLDEKLFAEGRSRRLALFSQGWNGTTPLWNARCRLDYRVVGLVWKWRVTEQGSGRFVGSGRRLTFGAMIWAAQRAAGA